MVGLDWAIRLCGGGSERGLVVAADAGGGARVVAAGRGRGCAAALRRGRPRVVARRTGRSLTAAATVAAVRRAARALGARHLGGGVLQRRTDLVDLDLEDGALLTLARLVLTRAEVALHDDTQPLLQGLGDVLRGLPPHRAGQEQRVAVLPLVG